MVSSRAFGILSANRDEHVFGATARQFDIARPVSPAHLAFGFGEHLCLGASLARLEAKIVFEQLLRRFPAYELLGPPTYVPSTLTRSIVRGTSRALQKSRQKSAHASAFGLRP